MLDIKLKADILKQLYPGLLILDNHISRVDLIFNIVNNDPTVLVVDDIYIKLQR